MNDKQLLKRLRELLVERQQNLENNDQQQENSQNQNLSYGSKQRTLGAYPGTGKFFTKTPNIDNTQNKNGFSTIFMLGFLTFFFETMFILVSYFIFK